MSNTSVEVLKQNLNHLSSSLKWLKRSLHHCRGIDKEKGLTPEDYDHFENLTSRFARTVDLLINKMLRSIDAVELLEPGSIIDAANRAESRGIIDSVDQLRDLKDLRNEIAHEYETDELSTLFAAVLDSVPDLIFIAGRVIDYCRQYV